MSLKRFLVLLLLFAIACKPPTPAEQMDAALSWISTAGMAGDVWLRHTTPDKYTRQTLELSVQTLRQIGADLLKSPPPAIDSSTLDQTFARSRFHIARMATLVTERNAPAFKVQLDSLRLDQKSVKEISDKVESSQ